MSEQTEWQKWCAETAPVMAAAGRGEVVQWLDGGMWCDKRSDSNFAAGVKYRIKPRTIRIGEYDVPEPMREAPEIGSRYWLVRRIDEVSVNQWKGDNFDKKWLGMGLCHAYMSSAMIHSEALISLTAKKD